MKRGNSSTEAVAIESEYESDDDNIPMDEIRQPTVIEGNSIPIIKKNLSKPHFTYQTLKKRTQNRDAAAKKSYIQVEYIGINNMRKSMKSIHLTQHPLTNHTYTI